MVHHFIVRAECRHPPKTQFRLRRWIERLVPGVHVAMDGLSAIGVSGQTHCAVHFDGAQMQFDLLISQEIDLDLLLKYMREFGIENHEVLVLDRTGEFRTLVSCVDPDDPNDSNEY